MKSTDPATITATQWNNHVSTVNSAVRPHTLFHDTIPHRILPADDQHVAANSYCTATASCSYNLAWTMYVLPTATGDTVVAAQFTRLNGGTRLHVSSHVVRIFIDPSKVVNYPQALISAVVSDFHKHMDIKEYGRIIRNAVTTVNGYNPVSNVSPVLRPAFKEWERVATEEKGSETPSIIQKTQAEKHLQTWGDTLDPVDPVHTVTGLSLSTCPLWQDMYTAPSQNRNPSL